MREGRRLRGIGAAVLVLFVASACLGRLPSEEPYPSWRKRGGSPSGFQQDREACLSSSMVEEGIVATRSATPRYAVDESAFRACMEGKGWRLPS